MSKWKKDESGVLIMDNAGNPILVSDDGQESAKDAKDITKDAGIISETHQTIQGLKAEAASKRKANKELETKLAAFGEIEDPAKFLKEANSAIETVKNLKDGDLIDADKAEKAREDLLREHQAESQAKHDTLEAQIKELKGSEAQSQLDIHNSVIKNNFMASKDIKSRLTQTPQALHALYRDKFKVERDSNGELVPIPINSDGNAIVSKVDPNRNASLFEALEGWVNAEPNASDFWRPNPSGAGAEQNAREPSKTNEMLKLSPAERLNAARQQT